ncbi:AraC family transcriptional regulator [Paenibacillus sp. J31TS4]|uniref:AraC family transcriptional regulator n=1 Tax=Paenibacillus sp. J31TS4 TaxID=2807195 RepID=UPI001B0E46F3|nr:AraC family transcriptional regulator [Paenibacillus sp. J31TS4]GIP41038.1 AraC family transcriptional regulator [Paenibacillus sp. J31TS4]
MALYPVYQDALSHANIKRGQFPFYISINTIQPSVPLHHHDFVELSFVIEGSGTEIINGRKHPMKPGTVSFLLPHHIHEIYSDPGTPIKVFCCMFDISLLFGSSVDAELGSLLLKAGETLSSYVDLPPEQADTLRILCTQMLEEHRGDRVGKNSCIRAKLIEALLLYLRANRNGESAESAPSGPESRRAIWAIIQYVHTHYLDHMTLEDLSRRFGLSVPYLSRTFKEQVGQSFLAYLHALRIRRASSLLITTQMTVSEIATEVGFDSFRTFSRVFKELKGQTPSEYRQAFVAGIPELAGGKQHPAG